MMIHQPLRAGIRQRQMGGAEVFVLLFVLVAGAAIGLYFFYYLPAQQKKSNSPDANATPEGNESPKSNKGPESEPISANSKNTNTGSSHSGSGSTTDANKNSGTSAGSNGSSNGGNSGSTNAPTFADDEVRANVEAAENYISRGKFSEAVDKLKAAMNLARDGKLSPDMTVRVVRADSRARVMQDFESVESIRGRLSDDEPIPVKIALQNGMTVLGSVYPKVLGQIYLKSTNERLGARWDEFNVSVDARNLRGEFVVALRIGGYQSVKYSDLNKFWPIAERDWDKHFEDKVMRQREVFENSAKSPVDKYLLARGLKRYAPRDSDSHDWLAEARELIDEALADDPNLYQSAALERSGDYQSYLLAVRQNDASKANRLLEKLLESYPFATQLSAARAAKQAGEDAMVKMEAQIQRAEENAERGPKVDVGRSDAVREAVNAPTNELLAKANEFYKKAQEFDNRAMPGRPNFREDLEQALYYYGCAREVLNKAEERGADARQIESMRVNINKAMFWCHKRQPIF